jgi:carboxyl-terminal processing protease
MKKTSFIGLVPALVFLLFLIISCSGSSSNDSLPQEYTPPTDADYSSQGWAEAFNNAHERFSKEYAFTDWKKIDFKALHDEFYPRIAAAEASLDTKSYYLAIREYLANINDGHISFPAIDETIMKEEIGYSYGLAIVELNDGRFIAAKLLEGGPAETAGIVQGTEIISWNGMSVEAAAAEIKPIWKSGPPATNDYAKIIRLNYLTRAPIGSTAVVVYKNPGNSTPLSAVLSVVDDSYLSPDITQWFARRPTMDQANRFLDYYMLPEGYGYLALYIELDLSDPGSYPYRVREKFSQALEYFIGNNAKGIIVDIRANFGGSDQLAADICGFFNKKKLFYEATDQYDARLNSFVNVANDEETGISIIGKTPTFIRPQTPYYGGYVVALVSPGNISSGEGVAMGIKNLAKGKVIGFNGTNGSFGIVGVHLTLPGPYTFRYAYGRSLNSSGIVQLDSNHQGIGGVIPDIRVPATYENIYALANGEDVELDYAIDYLNNIIH